MVALGWIPSNGRWDTLGLPDRAEYMIMQNPYACWGEQVSPDSIRGGYTMRVFNCALTAAGDLLLDSTEGGWASLCCCIGYV